MRFWLTILLVLVGMLWMCGPQVFGQCPGGVCPVVAAPRPVMIAPVYRYTPQQIGHMQYTPMPPRRIHYPTPIRDWFFGRYVGGGYRATYVPHH